MGGRKSYQQRQRNAKYEGGWVYALKYMVVNFEVSHKPMSPLKEGTLRNAAAGTKKKEDKTTQKPLKETR